MHFKYKDTERLKVKEWRKIYHADTIQEKVGVATLTSDVHTSEKGKLSAI